MGSGSSPRNWPACRAFAGAPTALSHRGSTPPERGESTHPPPLRASTLPSPTPGYPPAATAGALSSQDCSFLFLRLIPAMACPPASSSPALCPPFILHPTAELQPWSLALRVSSQGETDSGKGCALKKVEEEAPDGQGGLKQSQDLPQGSVTRCSRGSRAPEQPASAPPSTRGHRMLLQMCRAAVPPLAPKRHPSLSPHTHPPLSPSSPVGSAPAPGPYPLLVQVLGPWAWNAPPSLWPFHLAARHLLQLHCPG